MVWLVCVWCSAGVVVVVRERDQGVMAGKGVCGVGVRRGRGVRSSIAV